MRLFSTLLLLLVYSFSYAQLVSIDPSFNPADEGDGNATAQGNTVIKQTLTLPSNKIIVVGSFSRYRHLDSVRNGIVRLHADGSVDTSFKSGTGTAGPTGSAVHKVLRQPDGKLIIGGAFATFNGSSRSRIARLHEDGSLDTSFDPGAGFNNNAVVYALCLLPSGKILVGGSFYEYAGQAAQRLICLNSDGSPDTGFTASIPSGMVMDIKLRGDGKLLVAGSFTRYNGTVVGHIVCIDSTGSLDNTVQASLGGANAIVNALAIQPDGKILVGGNFTTFNGLSRNRLLRLHADGTLDLSFSSTNNFNNKVNGITVLSDGHIAIGGDFSYVLPSAESVNRFIILDANGIRDPSFLLSKGFSSAVWHINEWPGDRLLVSGSFTEYQHYWRRSIAFLNRDGSIAESFETGGNGANFTVRTVTGGANNSLYFGGGFSYYNNQFKGGFVKTTENGEIDSLMHTGTGFSGGDVYKIKELSDGSVLVAGNFNQYNGFSQPGLIRLNADGSVDSTFASHCNIGPGAVFDFALQADGKIILCGAFSMVNGITRQKIARLHSDGTLDPSFTPPAPLINSIRRILLLDDGKMFVAGGFSNWDGTGIDNLARLTHDGSIDATFNSGTGGNAINDMIIQPDGRIVVAGDFTQVNGTPVNRIARLEANGTLDTTFSIGTGVDWVINTMQYQRDGKILIGGGFTAVGGLPYSKLSRLKSNGNVDSSFEIGSGFGVGFNANEVYAIHVIDSSRILVTGRFGSYNGVKKNAIVKLQLFTGTPLPIYFLDFSATKKGNVTALLEWTVAEDSRNGHFEIQRSIDGATYQSVGTSFSESKSNLGSFTDLYTHPGKNFYRIKWVDNHDNFSYSTVRMVNFSGRNRPDLSLYPNPVKDLLHIRLNTPSNLTAEVTIYDAVGTLKLSKKIPAQHGRPIFSIAVADLTPGIYFLSHMLSDGSVSSKKFIKK